MQGAFGGDKDMYKEKRTGEKPVPDDFEEALSYPQRLALRQIERFGWNLKFVRRPLFLERVAVVFNPEDNKIGLLGIDGKIDMQTDIEVRELSVKKENLNVGDTTK